MDTEKMLKKCSALKCIQGQSKNLFRKRIGNIQPYTLYTYIMYIGRYTRIYTIFRYKTISSRAVRRTLVRISKLLTDNGGGWGREHSLVSFIQSIKRGLFLNFNNEAFSLKLKYKNYTRAQLRTTGQQEPTPCAQWGLFVLS